jgi:hypothetical protein
MSAPSSFRSVAAGGGPLYVVIFWVMFVAW